MLGVRTSYPLTEPKSAAYQSLVSRCQSDLARCGACELEGFISEETLGDYIGEAQSLSEKAHFNRLTGNAYLTEPAPNLPADHVERLTETTRLGAVAYDDFPENSLIRRLYEWDPLMHFSRDVLGLNEIYRYADPMGALNLAVMENADYLRWHFDQTDFVVSLAIRKANSGGDFEFVPRLRSDESPNYEKVRAVLSGSREGVMRLENRPGSLLIFQGRHTLHRVTPIAGDTTRLIVLFGFDKRPDTQSSPYLRQIRYGRAEPRRRT